MCRLDLSDVTCLTPINTQLRQFTFKHEDEHHDGRYIRHADKLYTCSYANITGLLRLQWPNTRHDEYTFLRTMRYIYVARSNK